ncbi:MAG: hypothetical protein M3P51_06480 [Chloroflexota bacterium]|nr:hypothetical protein [Chloroflexota bacterium]
MDNWGGHSLHLQIWLTDLPLSIRQQHHPLARQHRDHDWYAPDIPTSARLAQLIVQVLLPLLGRQVSGGALLCQPQQLLDGGAYLAGVKLERHATGRPIDYRGGDPIINGGESCRCSW